MMGLPKGQGNNLAAVALDEMVLFTPSWLLHSIELWETPGSGELNSRKAVALTEALETADAIMLFVSRSLETAKVSLLFQIHCCNLFLCFGCTIGLFLIAFSILSCTISF
jgi:hypothetical protein